MNKKNIRSRKFGFTLLEMIVSLGIFSVVAVIAVGSLVRITGLNRQAQSLQLAMNNISYVLESISRELRFATTIRCVNNTSGVFNSSNLSSQVNNCHNSNAGSTIVFRSTKSGFGCQLIYAYWFDKPSGSSDFIIKKSQQRNCGDEVKLSTASEIVDSTNVKITNVSLDLDEGSNGYSWIGINIKGYSGKKENEKNNFDITTGISQRVSE